MFVSTSAATTIKVLSVPPPALCRCRGGAIIPFPLSGRRQIEAAKALGKAHCLDLPPRRDDANQVPGSEPFDFVTRANTVEIRHRLGNRDLKLRRHLGHILTIARI